MRYHNTPRTSDSADIVFWRSIVDATTAEDFEAYLTQFPTGAFASLARIKLKRLAKRRSHEDESRQILYLMSDVSETTVQDILSPSRVRELARPRQVTAYLMREYTSLSMAAIGRILGDRDHSTIMRASNRVKELIASREEPEIIEWIEAVRAKLT